MNIFILNNFGDRNHSEIYSVMDGIDGFPIYDYSDQKANFKFNSDFFDIKVGDLVLIADGKRLIHRMHVVTGVSIQHCPEESQNVNVLHGKVFGYLGKSIVYSDFFTLFGMSCDKLDKGFKFYRRMLVAKCSPNTSVGS